MSARDKRSGDGEDRRQRLADALRANLRRRKDQTKGRRTAVSEDSPASPESSPGGDPADDAER